METATLIVPVDNELHLQTENGQVVVSSRVVAERFGKEHSNVTRDIEVLIGGILKIEDTHKDGAAEKSVDLFIPSQYQHPQNKQWYPEYLLTRDGFTLLAMGFTGQEALKWKLKYIEAFNKMEQALREQVPLLEYNQELQELDKVAKIIGLSKQDKLVVVLSIMKRHNAPTLGLEELAVCTQTKQIKNQQSVNDVIDYICDHNPVGFSIKEYYKNYLLHCAKNGLNPMDKVPLGKVIRQLGYESKCKRIDGEACKVWFEIGGN